MLFKHYVSKKKHDLHIAVLKSRIHELEEILCPCSQHDFVHIGTDIEPGNSPEELLYIHTVQCKRCKKVVRQRSYEV